MARLDHIHRRLIRWGAWRARREDYGLGFSKVNILLSLGGGGAGGYREAVIPTDELEAAEIDRAVESLKLVKSHLYLTLHYIYIKNQGVTGTARAMARSRAAINAQLDQADVEIHRWLEDLRKQRVSAEKRSFTP